MIEEDTLIEKDTLTEVKPFLEDRVCWAPGGPGFPGVLGCRYPKEPAPRVFILMYLIHSSNSLILCLWWLKSI